MPSTQAIYFRIGVSAVILQDERVLLAHRTDIDWWNLPGGGMERGETVEEAVKREVAEETGLQVVVERLIGVYSKPQKEEVVLSFLCRIAGGTLTTSDEADECRFFERDAMPSNTLPKHRERVLDAYLGGQEALIRNQLTTTEEDQHLLVREQRVSLQEE